MPLFQQIVATLAVATVSVTTHAGLLLPATEDFESGNANWFGEAGVTRVDWLPNGGFDGGGYVTTSTVVPDPAPEFGQILFRAQDEFGSSDGIFEGDWISSGVKSFGFWIRHDAFAPVGVFARFAGPANFPGAAGLSFAPVAPNVWTFVSIDIFDGNPAIVLEGTTFDAVFSNIGHVQVGILPGDELVGQDIVVDLDHVSAVPAPGAFLLFIAAATATRRRRVGAIPEGRPRSV